MTKYFRFRFPKDPLKTAKISEPERLRLRALDKLELKLQIGRQRGFNNYEGLKVAS